MIEIAAVEVRPSLLPSFVPVLDRIFSPTTSISLPFVIQGRRRPHCSIFCGFEKKDDPYLGVVIKSACTMTTTLHIVVIGGSNGCLLSSVDIIDTAITSNHTVIVGPSMTVPRSGSASAVIGDRIFVVGGLTGYNLEDLKSVEYVEIPDPSGNETKATAGAAFPSSFRWTLHHKLKLSILPTRHAVVAVGSCLIVMGGSVDVLDTRRNTVWTFPPSTGYRCAYSAVVHSRGIAVIGGNGNAACATLSLVDKNTWCFRRLIEQVPSTIFGTRTNSLPSAPKRTTPSNELTRDEDNVN